MLRGVSRGLGCSGQAQGLVKPQKTQNIESAGGGEAVSFVEGGRRRRKED